MEPLFDNPIAVTAIVVLIAAVLLGRALRRRQRAAQVEELATDQGWTSVDQPREFADLVAGAVPELAQQASSQARRASHRSTATSGSRNVPVSKGTGRSSSKARNVYLADVGAGSVAIGDVQISAGTGSLPARQGSVRRGAVAATLAEPVPTLQLTSRATVELGRDDDLPDGLASAFRAEQIDADARAHYLDSGAWTPLVGDRVDLDQVTVDGDRLVLVAAEELTPERAEALVAVAERFAAEVVPQVDADHDRPLVTSPLAST